MLKRHTKEEPNLFQHSYVPTQFNEELKADILYDHRIRNGEVLGTVIDELKILLSSVLQFMQTRAY